VGVGGRRDLVTLPITSFLFSGFRGEEFSSGLTGGEVIL
jgi:hypothetical protein